MSTANKEIAARYGEDLWGRGNVAVVEELFAPDVVDNHPFPGQEPGRDGVRQILKMFREAFPDLQVRNEEVLAEGYKVVLRWTANGTYKGGLLGIPSSGQKVKLSGIDVLRISNGKIVERWAEDNGLEMMQQLGVIPQS